MTNTFIATYLLKKLSDNTNTPPKSSITQRLRNDWGHDGRNILITISHVQGGQPYEVHMARTFVCIIFHSMSLQWPAVLEIKLILFIVILNTPTSINPGYVSFLSGVLSVSLRHAVSNIGAVDITDYAWKAGCWTVCVSEYRRNMIFLCIFQRR